METDAPQAAGEEVRGETAPLRPSSEQQLAKWNVTSELRNLSLTDTGDTVSTSNPPTSDVHEASSTQVLLIEGGESYEFDFSKGPPDYSTMDRMKKLEVMS